LDTGVAPRQGLSEIFPGGLSPCEHFMQVYDSDEALLGLLGTFVEDGLQQDDAVIVIATDPHLVALGERLVARGIDVVAARWQGLYVPLSADLVLSQFSSPQGGIDEARFVAVIGALVDGARAGTDRRVRGFGEMVALLWRGGRHEDTVKLERLWNRLCREQRVAVMCAYPLQGFEGGQLDTIRDVCAAHSRLVVG